jgi:hypothetical protein
MRRASILLAVSLAMVHASWAERRCVSLDGSWEIAQGVMGSLPQEFPATVVVPGLVDLRFIGALSRLLVK